MVGQTRSARRPRKFLRVAIVGGLIAALSTLSIAAATPAFAGTTVDSTPVAVASSSADLGGYTIIGFEPITLSVFHLNVTAHATWSGDLTTAVSWDSGKVRQGSSLDVTRQVSATSGNIAVQWVVTGTVSPLGLGNIDIGTVNLSKDDVTCAPQLTGGAYHCKATSDAITLVETPGIPLSPYVKLAIQVDFGITPQGAVVTRNFTIGGNPAATAADLSLTSDPQTETFAIPCNTNAGDSVAYAQDPMDWAPATTSSQQPVFQIGLMDPVFGLAELPAIFNAPFGSPVNTNPAFDLTGAHTTDLGALLANNVPPTIDPVGPFSGTEGAPVAFSAVTHSQCPITSYVWQFSDGTTSFGPSPQRAFGQDGIYSGQLTVTDQTGLSATQSFSVNIANAPPVPSAGPDTSGAWGRPIAFNGQAVDPGWLDQPTLTYSWDWGDGTPGTGGASAHHTYALPGPYTATLTVCDDHVCVADTAAVTVRSRDTSTAYLGDYSGTYDTPGTVSASVVDEFGQAVNGRPVTFQVATDGPFTGNTNSSGIATKSYTPTLAAGSYSTPGASASFAGDALYNASNSGNNTFAEAKKATTTTYTGATTGGPNKTVVLSAVLKDATNKPLANKTIQFQLGTQSASATTDASGVASVSLKLNQKNGTYNVSATYAGDASFYTGSSQSATFKLQAK
jgi:PKD repeat protein